jgi:hypothetical protein
MTTDINTYDDIVNIPTLIMEGLILLRDIYSIIVCIDNFDLTEGYLQYHQPDSDNESFDLTEGYLPYHRTQVSIHTMIL